MTRQEFIDDVNDFGMLKDFCSDFGCEYLLEDVIDSDQLDDYVWDDISNWNADWRSLGSSLAALADIDIGYGWYVCNGMLDYAGVDNTDFQAYKGDVLDWADNHSDVFDDEEVEDEEDERDVHGAGYYFTDPITGEILVAGERLECPAGHLDLLFGT